MQILLNRSHTSQATRHENLQNVINAPDSLTLTHLFRNVLAAGYLPASEPVYVLCLAGKEYITYYSRTGHFYVRLPQPEPSIKTLVPSGKIEIFFQHWKSLTRARDLYLYFRYDHELMRKAGFLDEYLAYQASTRQEKQWRDEKIPEWFVQYEDEHI